MTAPTMRRTGRTRVSTVGIGRKQAQCSCGWRGPDRFVEAVARTDQQRHKDEGVHRGLFAGAWLQQQQWGPIHGIDNPTAAGPRRLVFDPPNVLWPAGGQRIRVEDYDTDRPILAVEEFSGEIRRYQLVPQAVTK